MATGRAPFGASAAQRRAGAESLKARAARVAAVVLAAGGSSRMGRAKQLIRYADEPLVLRAANAAMEAGANPVFVVTGADAAEVNSAISGVPGIRIVINAEWQTGLASSLAAGLSAARDNGCDGVLVTLCDQPLMDAAVLSRLIAAFRAGARIVASGYDGAPGVPALFGREHIPELLGLKGDAGAGAWLRSRASEVLVLPLDHAALDVDTPEDLARLADPHSFR